MDLLDRYDELLVDTDSLYAREIYDCDDCPLQGDYCTGVTSTPNGYREPPCTSWDDDTLISKGMYDYDFNYD